MDKATIIVQIKMNGEPNETEMTVTKIDGTRSEWCGHHGFEAYDIYNLLMGYEEEKEIA